MKATTSVVSSLFVVLLAAPAAALSGVITGTWVYTDNRGDCCSGTGCQHDTCGLSDTIKYAETQIRTLTGSVVGTGTTNTAGTFSISWFDPLCSSFPCSLKARFYLANPGDFEVLTDGGGSYSFTTSTLSITSSNQNIGTWSAGGQERLGVYETANEMWVRVINNSSYLQSHMGFRTIEFPAGITTAYHTLGPCSWGFANDVYVADSEGNDRPFAVAHEIGHCVSDVAYGVAWLSLDPGETCLPAHELDHAHDCEALAFNEGLADFWSTAWAFTNNATHASWENFPVEDLDPSADCIGLNCATEGCINAALWDIYDDPSGDDDPIDDGDTSINIATMVNVLVQYADGCSYFADNRCSNEESTQDARNIWDWLENFDDVLPSMSGQARDIYDSFWFDNECEEEFNP